MPAYVVHSSRERLRLRHPFFSNEQNKLAAMEVLKNIKGIAAIKPGASSILLLREPEMDLEEVCRKLEAAFPDIARQPLINNQQEEKRNGVAAKVKTLPAMRNIELKSLLSAGITTVGLALVGLHGLHALAGGVFTLLATQHVWQRRKRL